MFDFIIHANCGGRVKPVYPGHVVSAGYGEVDICCQLYTCLACGKEWKQCEDLPQSTDLFTLAETVKEDNN